MKELEMVKNGKLFTDDIGLAILWKPIIDKVIDPKGIITYRTVHNSPVGLFHVIKNETDYVGEIKIIDEDGFEVILDVRGRLAKPLVYGKISDMDFTDKQKDVFGIK